MMRLLTPTAIRQIAYFYKRPVPIGFGTIFAVAFVPWLPIVMGMIMNFNSFWLVVVVEVAIIGMDQYVFRRKITRAREVYQFGDEITIYLEGMGSNYGSKMNGAPQQVITIRKGGDTELLKIKTFSPRVVKAFSLPSQKAFILDKYPGILLPETIFSAGYFDPDKPKQPRSKSINI